MHAKINKIATIHTGLFAKPVSDGNVAYLQARHFDEAGNVVTDLFTTITQDQVADRHLLHQGDVLFAAKGSKNFATVVPDISYPVVASTSFFILRVYTGNILPEYLATVLNHTYFLGKLQNASVGTSLQSISKKMLENLIIPVPDVNTQLNIIKLQKLRQREQKLINEIEKLRDKLIELTILKTINR